MSIYFVSQECENLWNPSSIVARTFCDQVASVGRALSVPTGLGPIVSDEVEVDVAQFSAFAQAFTALMLQTDPSSGVHVLLGGCFGIVAALASKLGTPLPEAHLPTISAFVAAGAKLVG